MRKPRKPLASRLLFSFILVTASTQLWGQDGNWTSGGPAGSYVRSIAVDPADFAKLYVATDLGIFRSFDRGRTWTQSNDGLNNPDAHAVAVDARTPETVYAGTVNPGVVYRSLDSGGTWSRSDAGLSEGWVTQLMIDSANPEHLYASASAGLFISENGAESWRILLAIENARFTVDPVTSTILVAAYGGRVPTGGFFESVDHGATWAEFTALRNIARPISIAFDPRNPAILFAGGESGEFATSSDGGANWVIRTGPSLPRETLVDPADQGVLYGISQFGAIVTSLDNGQSWNPLNPQLSNLVATTLAIDPAGMTLYAGTIGGGVYELEIADRRHPVRPAGPRPRVRVVPRDPK